MKFSPPKPISFCFTFTTFPHRRKTALKKDVCACVSFDPDHHWDLAGAGNGAVRNKINFHAITAEASPGPICQGHASKVVWLKSLRTPRIEDEKRIFEDDCVMDIDLELSLGRKRKKSSFPDLRYLRELVSYYNGREKETVFFLWSIFVNLNFNQMIDLFILSY